VAADGQRIPLTHATTSVDEFAADALRWRTDRTSTAPDKPRAKPAMTMPASVASTVFHTTTADTPVSSSTQIFGGEYLGRIAEGEHGLVDQNDQITKIAHVL